MKNKRRLLQKERIAFKTMLIQLFFLSVFTLLLFSRAQAQDQLKGKPDYSNEPAWIKMIDNPDVNYYEAMKAYDEYWKHHKKPAGEEEEMAEGKRDYKELERETKREIKKDQKKKLHTDDLIKLNENEEMKYQVKRFQQWAREMKPFVQEDGRILSDRERIDIWKKQQEEISKQQK